MARFVCTCGAVLTNQTDSESELVVHYVLTTKQFGEFSEDVYQGNKYLSLPDMQYWKCPSCGRLSFFSKGLDSTIAVYTREK
jgi:rubredoxin